MFFRKVALCLIAALVPSTAFADEAVTLGVVFPGKNGVYEEVVEELKDELADEPIRLTVAPTDDVLNVPGRVTAVGQAKALGKLAKTDLLINFEAGRDAQLLGVATHDVSTGLLLADDAVAGLEPNEIAKVAGRQIRAAIAKTKTDVKSVRTAIVQQPASSLYLGSDLPLAALTELVERRLSASPNLAIALNSDVAWDAVRGAVPKPRLTDADYAISISAERTEDQRLKLTVGIKGRDELNIFSVEGKQLDAKLAETVAAKIGDACGVAKLADQPSADTITRRYTVIAESLWAQNKKRGSLRATELAALFAPTDTKQQRSLSKRLMEEAYNVALRKPNAIDWSDKEQQLFVGRAFQIERQLVEQLAEDDDEAIRNELRYPDTVHRMGNMQNLIRRMQERIAPPQLATLKDHFHFCLTRPIELLHRSTEAKPELMYGYSLVLAHRMNQLCRIEVPNTATGQAAVDAAMRWLSLFDKIPDDKKTWQSAHIVLRNITVSGMVRDEEVLKPLFERLDRHPHSFMKLFSQQGRLTQDWLKRKPEPAEKAKQFREVRDAALAVLDAAREAQQRRVVDGTLLFLDESFNRLIRSSEMANEMLDTSEELMKREIVRSRILLDACQYVDEDSAQRAHKLIKELITLCSAKPNAIRGGSPQIAITRAEQQLAKLESKWPKLRGEPAEELVTVKPLLNFADLPLAGAQILQPRVRGTRVYAIAVANDGGGAVAQLVSTTLDEGKTKALGQIRLPKGFIDVRAARRDLVTAGWAAEESYFAALNGVGLVEFDMREPRAAIVVEAKNLPGRIQSLALAGSQIYAGIEGGRLVKIRPMARTVEPLAATDVARIKTPLDDRPPFAIPHVLDDAARRRLLIVVQEGPGNKGAAELWEYDLKSGKFNLLHRLGRTQLGINAHLSGDTLTLADVWIATFNFKTGKNTLVANYPLNDLEPTRKIWIDGLHRPAMCGDSAWWINYNGCLGQLTYPDGKPKTYYSKKLVLDEFDTSDRGFAVPIDSKRFLLYHARQLWLATPKTSPGDEVPGDEVKE